VNRTKPSIPFVLLLLLTSSALSQQRNKPAVENNLYYRALFASLEKMDREWGKINDAAMRKRARTDYHNMIMQWSPWITDELPSQLGEYRIEYLNSRELVARYIKLRKEFPTLKVYPMVNEGERLCIHFNVYWVSYNKRGLNYALSDWSKVYFRYDCERREYVIDEVKLRGV
jgi:hypothetical protein